MAENDFEPQADAGNDIPADEQNVEYEYVELEEGQELPDGYEYEYEYVEVPAEGSEEPSELDVLGARRAGAVAETTPELQGSIVPEGVASAGEDKPTFNRPAAPTMQTAETEMKFMNEDFVVDSASANDYQEFIAPVSSPVSDVEQGRPKDKALSDYIFGDDEEEDEIEASETAEASVGGEVRPVPEETVAEETSIEAAAGEMSLDEMLGEVQEPQIDVSVLDDNFGLDRPRENEVVSSGVESSPAETFDVQEETLEPVESSEESEIRYQNQDITDGAATENWFQKNEVEGAYDPADVHVEYLGESIGAGDESSRDVEAYLEPGAVVSPSEAAVSGNEILAVTEEGESEVRTEDGIESASEAVSADEGTVETAIVDTAEPDEDVEYAEPTEIIEDFGENGIYEPRISEVVEEVVSEPSAVLPSEQENAPDLLRSEPDTANEAVAKTNDAESLPTDVSAKPESAFSQELSAADALENGTKAFVEAAAATEGENIIRSETAERLIPVEDFAEISVTDCSAAEYEQAGREGKTVTKNDGVQSFRGTIEQSSIVLNEIDFANNELSAWNLILFSRELMPLTSKVSEVDMPIGSGVSRFVTLVRSGRQKAEFFNEETLRIINATEACVAVEGRFVCGDLGTNSGVIINDYKTIPLADFAGKKVSFVKPSSGLLAGPKGCLLYFFNVKHILFPDAETAKIDAEKLQYKISKWYSGTLNDKYFEFDANSASAEFTGNDEVKAIHVNVNNSSYGWNVAFDNGLSMNLRDLREFQTRFGKMPSPNGIITYGEKKLTFSNVERIVVYESAQYFFYS